MRFQPSHTIGTSMLITTTLNNISIVQNAINSGFYDMGFVLYAFVSYCVILGVFGRVLEVCLESVARI